MHINCFVRLRNNVQHTRLCKNFTLKTCHFVCVCVFVCVCMVMSVSFFTKLYVHHKGALLLSAQSKTCWYNYYYVASYIAN